ncbi:MAG: hypothetical protein STSR0004_19210 [Peptococcaceae bacterium]
MVINTLYGTAKLLYEKSMKFDDVVTRVATKGGITQEGVKVLEDKLPEIFNEVFKVTLAKHEMIKNTIQETIISIMNNPGLASL